MRKRKSVRALHARTETGRSFSTEGQWEREVVQRRRNNSDLTENQTLDGQLKRNQFDAKSNADDDATRRFCCCSCCCIPRYYRAQPACLLAGGRAIVNLTRTVRGNKVDFTFEARVRAFRHASLKEKMGRRGTEVKWPDVQAIMH